MRAVAGRGLAGRARRRAAADGRVLVALREVPERQPARAERALGLGQPQARLAASPCSDARSTLDTRVHAAPGRARSPRRSRRAAARRRRRRSCRRRTARPRRRPRAHASSTARTCVVRAPGAHDGVRRIARSSPARRRTQVGVALARGVQHARGAVVAHVLGADDRRAAGRAAPSRRAPARAGARPASATGGATTAPRHAELRRAGTRSACVGQRRPGARARPSPSSTCSRLTRSPTLAQPVERLVELPPRAPGAA